MKNIKYITICFLVLVFIAAPKAESQENQPEYNTEFESINIRTVDSVEMAGQTENVQAMAAYILGTNLMRQNELDLAEKLFIEAISLDPKFVDAIDHLGIVYRRQNRLEEAEAMYLRSIELNKENTVPFINLAVIYRIWGRLNDAFQLYSHVVQIQPNYPEGYYGMGEWLYIAGNYEYAIAFFDRAIELYNEINSPVVYDAYYYKGMILYSFNEYDEALYYLEEAKKGNPNNKTLLNTINEIKKRK